MDGKRTFGKVIPDDKLLALSRVLFGTWFKKWKDLKTDDEFMEAWKELDEIMAQGSEYPVVSHLCVSLMYELDARLYGGYTETTRSKILAIIKGERYGT